MPIRRPCTAAALGVTLVAACVLPVRRDWQNAPRDSFPLSHYPMFTAVRGRDTIIVHLVGVTSTGARRPVPGRLVATGGMNQIRKQLTLGVTGGHGKQLAERAAAAVAGRRAYADIVEIELGRGRYRLADWERSRGRFTQPRQFDVVASAPVASPGATS